MDIFGRNHTKRERWIDTISGALGALVGLLIAEAFDLEGIGRFAAIGASAMSGALLARFIGKARQQAG